MRVPPACSGISLLFVAIIFELIRYARGDTVVVVTARQLQFTVRSDPNSYQDGTELGR